MLMCDFPLITIGIPTYNRPNRLRRLISSLVQQTYSNLEIIVSDNCSLTSATEEVIREFQDERIRYIRQPKNIGLFYNFKYVLDLAQGEYFAWAADDDVRSPEFVEACLKELQQHNGVILVNTFSQLIDPCTNQVVAVDKGCTTINLHASKRYRRYLTSIYNEQAAVGDLIYGLIKRDLAKQVMHEQKNIISWDHVFLARLSLAGEFLTISKPLMQSSPNGASTNLAKIAKIQLIEGSLSEKSPNWVREIHLQKAIFSTPNLSFLQKKILATWSYLYYIRSSYKMMIKGLFPRPYEYCKSIFLKAREYFS